MSEHHQPTLEQPTDDWRQVEHVIKEYVPHDLGGYDRETGCYYTTQRRYLVSTGGPFDATVDPPIDKEGNEIPYVPVPGMPLWYWPVKSEWRDLPIVSHTQVGAEKAEAGEGCKISTV